MIQSELLLNLKFTRHFFLALKVLLPLAPDLNLVETPSSLTAPSHTKGTAVISQTHSKRRGGSDSYCWILPSATIQESKTRV